MALSCLLRGVVKQTRVNSVSELLKSHLRITSQATQLHTLTADRKPTNWSAKFPLVEAAKQFSTTSVVRSAHGDHSKIWTAERFLSAGMVGILPAAMLMPSPLLDTLMAVAIVMHMHWGIEAIVVDYIRPVIFGPVIPKVGVVLVYVLSIAVLAGLLNLIFNDVGLANSIRMFWKL